MQQSGDLFIVSAPSGAGKTRLVNALTQQDSNIELSISYTTRDPRPGEQNGVHYHFITEAQFEGMIAAGHFLEQAEVFGHYYGTAESALRQQLATGKDVILEIDWQGALQVRHLLPQAVSIFILPPSYAILRQRLKRRGQDSDAVIAARMAEAKNQILHYAIADYLLVNDIFEEALAELHAIIISHRLRQMRQQPRLEKLLTELLSSDN